MQKYTTIFWDLDQTLLDFLKSQDYALRFCIEKLGLPIDSGIVLRYSGINDSYRQYIVTNGVNSTQENKMKLSGLNKLVDGVFVSELIGYPKPMKEFFDACFAKLPEIL